MTHEPRILTTWVDPPFPNGGHWQAHDDRMGADTSPIGHGRTQDEAVEDLLIKLEDRAA